MGHDFLRGPEKKIPQRNHRERRNVRRASASETGDYHSECAKKLAGIECSFFAEPLHNSAGGPAVNYRVANADHEQRLANATRAPTETVNREQCPNRKRFVRDVSEKRLRF